MGLSVANRINAERLSGPLLLLDRSVLPERSARVTKVSTKQHTLDRIVAEPPPELAVGERIVRKKELVGRVGRTYSYICGMMERGEFPRPRDFHGAPAWLDSEITAWIRGLPPRLVRGDPGAAEKYATQRKMADASAESRRRALAKMRRDNVRKRARRSPPRKGERLG
jgi:predicted DNA-binding transcriptional regulator AlpA